MVPIRLQLAQINTTVGDIPGNVKKILRVLRQSKKDGVSIVAFPELSIPGYPPEDLLLRGDFVRKNKEALRKIGSQTKGIVAVVGFVDGLNPIYNSAAVLANGRLVGVYHKMELPNYGVFDEKRYFACGTKDLVFRYRGIQIGVNVCEDIWIPHGSHRVQSDGGRTGLLINISSSPYRVNKKNVRLGMLRPLAKRYGAFYAYCNLVGGQDELVFDGHSLVLGPDGRTIAEGKAFEEDMLTVDLEVEPSQTRKTRKSNLPRPKVFSITDFRMSRPTPIKPRKKVPALKLVEEAYRALVLGTRDYTLKNGFQKVVLALSGGIDSTLTCAIAVDALGPNRVVTVFLPSRFTSKSSERDARRLAKNLGVSFLMLPIQRIVDGYEKTLRGLFQKSKRDITEENIQARVRGNLVMALSNKFGWLVLTTGNKSEMSVGYCTLYGDMAGGYAVINDVPKTLVYKLAEFVNQKYKKPPIPKSIFTKAPSAELRPNQKDSDSLPDYDILDPILEAYVVRDLNIVDIQKLGYSASVVKGVTRLVDRNEYKRRQGAPGIKITKRAFGKDWRLPITNLYRY